MAVIPKEQIAAYQRWQVNSFDTEADEATTEPAPSSMQNDPQTSEAGELVSGVSLPTAEDIERIHSDAQQEGYRAGYEAGFAEGQLAGQQATEAQVQQMAALLDNLRDALQQVDQTMADAVLDLALEAARQVVRSTLRAQPELLLPVIREAISNLPLHHGVITLHLHPDDAALVRSHLGEQLPSSGWHVLEDPAIEAGGCYLKAGASEVDATMATRWQRVLESIGAQPSSPQPDA